MLEDMRKKQAESEYPMDINENRQILYLKLISAGKIYQTLLMRQKLLFFQHTLNVIFFQKIDEYF